MNRPRRDDEIFTPSWLVEKMLDKLPRETWQQDKTFLDNSCGEGVFLVVILKRKLQKGHAPLPALNSIFGADIMADNIEVCRHRLLAVVEAHEEITTAHCAAVLRNIKWLDLAKYPNGSLDYDFAFEDKITQKQAEQLFFSYRRKVVIMGGGKK